MHSMTCKFVQPLLLALRTSHAEFMRNNDQDPVSWNEGTSIRMILAILCLRAQHLQLPGCADQCTTDPDLYTRVRAMVSNTGLWPGQTRHEALLPLWSKVLNETLPEGWMPPDEELSHLLGAQTCSHFTLWLPDFTSYGMVADPYAALTNHSCHPNACHTASGPQFCTRLVAMQDIAKGDPLVVSYLASDATFEERQESTLKQYCFQCACPRCQDKTTLPITTACPCGGWMYPNGDEVVCSICMQPPAEDEIRTEGGEQQVDNHMLNEVDDDREEEQEFSEEEDAGNSDSDDTVGEDDNMASTDCKCGGWRFKTGNSWLCMHCDHKIRIAEGPLRCRPCTAQNAQPWAI